jgi:hypothetical protein
LSHPGIKDEDLKAFLEQFSSTLLKAITKTQGKNGEDEYCLFCGHQGHYIGACLVCQQYITDGKCKKNAEGKIVLMTGQYCPRNIPGRHIKDRIDEWNKRNAASTTSLLYSFVPATTHNVEPQVAVTTTSTQTTEDRIAALEQEIFQLRSTNKKFDGVEILRRPRPGPAKPGVTSADSTSPSNSKSFNDKPSQPATDSRQSAPANSTTKPTSETTNTTRTTSTSMPKDPPVHPFAKVNETAYLPPHERNFASVPTSKNTKESVPTYHSIAPVQDPRIAIDVYTRSMKAPFVTLTPEELMSISAEVRNKVREAVTPRRIQSH